MPIIELNMSQRSCVSRVGKKAASRLPRWGLPEPEAKELEREDDKTLEIARGAREMLTRDAREEAGEPRALFSRAVESEHEICE